jgi:DNA modification methylase
MSYGEFLATKARQTEAVGFEAAGLSEHLFPFQRDVVRWALRRGRAAIFADCGLGKTLMQLDWAQKVAAHTGGRVLILTPLAVAAQTQREASKFGIRAAVSRDGKSSERITITNYEILDRFNPADYAGIVLDESSILKNYTGKTRNEIIEAFAATPYRLACTATPAPNDHMELGNHAEFLGVMPRVEMLAMFFVHDGGETQKWRLKGHAEKPFWRWVSSWAAMIRKPSDLGYKDDGFTLPDLRTHSHVVDVDRSSSGDSLFRFDAQTLSERLSARRDSVAERAAEVAELAGNCSDQWLVWCNLNAESEAVTRLIPDAVEVRGSDSPAKKEEALLGFVDGRIRVLVTKPSIAGFGMNLQNCHRVAFLGLSDSYEQYYQAVRRCWRFGQDSPVDVHIVTAATEGAVLKNIQRKEADAETMCEEMVQFVAESVRDEIKTTKRSGEKHETDDASGPEWRLMLGDCVERIAEVPDGSVDYTIFSPPFASLYTYTDSDRDMGNCKDHEAFYNHFAHLVPELYRVTAPGRLLSFHCMNLPTSKARDGYIGLSDFRGVLIRAFQDAGWIYHSEVVIWKDPVTAMQRTKALGLLYKQLRKDSAMSRQGIPDYLVTMRKPGDNAKPIEHTHEDFPVGYWQQYASPVWMDVNPSRTLQHRSAREEKDERHICPLQLDVIERALDLWTAKGDLVLSPFAGIGSEGWCAVSSGRRFVGIELKRSYWEQARKNLKEASPATRTQLQMFA